jgi:hypothetical protein
LAAKIEKNSDSDSFHSAGRSDRSRYQFDTLASQNEKVTLSSSSAKTSQMFRLAGWPTLIFIFNLGNFGRLLTDKMPTGFAVSPAMNHGGPYPATGHPGFTPVGIPASLRRFAALQCYDNVRPNRLPPPLRD